MANAEAIQAAMQRIMAENKPNSGTRPPNLQPTEDTHKNCSTCVHWDGRGTCQMYDYKTHADEVCDSWEPKPE